MPIFLCGITAHSWYLARAVSGQGSDLPIDVCWVQMKAAPGVPCGMVHWYCAARAMHAFVVAKWLDVASCLYA